MVVADDKYTERPQPVPEPPETPPEAEKRTETGDTGKTGHNGHAGPTEGLFIPPDSPDEPSDADEAAYHTFSYPDGPGDPNANVIVIPYSPGNYEVRFGPDTAYRDRDLIARGRYRFQLAGLGKDILGPDGPTISLEEYRQLVQAGVDRNITTDDETREVLHNERNDWPTPPDEAVYHGLAGDIIRTIAPHTEADPIGMLGVFLTMFGHQAGDGPYVHQGSMQRTNIFTTLVGDTSIGRKGTATSAITALFRMWVQSHDSRFVYGLGSGEGLLTNLRQNAEDPRALIFETEFGRMLIAMTREGSTVSPMVRNAWDGVPIGRDVANASHSATVRDHHVSILANITSGELAQKLATVESANGFGNRFLWLSVRRANLLPFTPRLDDYFAPFMNRLNNAIEYAKGTTEVHFSDAARVLWSMFYRERAEQPRTGFMASLTDRTEPYVVRLALLYALLDRSNYIEPEHLEAGIALAAYSERSAVYIFGDSTGDRHADALLAMLRDHSPIPWDEAKRDLGIRAKSEMDKTVLLLERSGRVREAKISRPGGGRPRRELELVR